MICETDQSHSKWCRGRVIETIEVKDSLVRVAKVQIINGKFWHPANKLAVLDAANPVDS